MISVVIPSAGDPQGLWSTVLSVNQVIRESVEILPVVNGTLCERATFAVEQLPNVRVIRGDFRVDSPQAARHLGILEAAFDTVVCLDSHVHLPDGFFDVLARDFEESGADSMGTLHRFNRLKAEEPIWPWELEDVGVGKSSFFPVTFHSHGAFAIRKNSYLKAGGYWRALRGFGGEEAQLCWKMRRLGMSCFVTTNTYHWHWLPLDGGRHEYASLMRDRSYCRNFLMVSAAYGDPGQLQRSWDWLVSFGGSPDFPELLEEVRSSNEVEEERRTFSEARN